MYQPNYGFNCCQPTNTGCCNTGCGGGYGYALILVLFILLVIIGTARW
ncbi:MAG: YjcZ family sporulation protein [Bacilli bacterium]|nr:YjcZ family sporulation protein [Bacilli bacterium]